MITNASHSLDLAILNDQGVPLASVVSKDLGSIKVEFKCFCELASWVGNEPELQIAKSINQTETMEDERRRTFNVHPVCRWDPAPHPKHSSQKDH